MSQLIYLIIIFIISFILSLFYLICIRFNKFVKLIITILSTFIFTFTCYKYNYFIFNEYVVLDVLYAIYIAYIVKSHVNKKNKM
jgi:hypothetical protein